MIVPQMPQSLFAQFVCLSPISMKKTTLGVHSPSIYRLHWIGHKEFYSHLESLWLLWPNRLLESRYIHTYYICSSPFMPKYSQSFSLVHKFCWLGFHENWIRMSHWHYTMIKIYHRALLLFEGICGHWNGNFTLRGHLPSNQKSESTQGSPNSFQEALRKLQKISGQKSRNNFVGIFGETNFS